MKVNDQNSLGRILIVDDESMLLDALCDTLRDQGFYVTGFTSAHEALAFLGSNAFDMILSDLNMPDMDGIALLQKVRGIDENMVGIIMTGQGSINTAVDAMKRGAMDYIQKPFKLKAIMPIINRAMALRALKLENIRLDHDLKKRTAELEVVVKDLEAYTSYVSHDLKAPLGFVKNFADMIVDEHSEGLQMGAVKLLSQIKNYTRRMESIIDDLLAFSRSGKDDLDNAEVDMNDLVNMVIDHLQPDKTKYQIRVHDLETAWGDVNLLSQVLVNLISNAIKYSGKKDNPTIEIGCERYEHNTVYYVKDNGAGFKPQNAELIFEAFKRDHYDVEFEGTGIGLAIAKRIVNRHNGQIRADSIPGIGATFYFTLPNA
ncbi:MAG: response regulator [Marinoscillum sp.]